VAERWQAFVSNNTVTGTISCQSTRVEHETYVAVSNPTLSPNYPNPFNPATTFTFSVPKPSKIEFRIYNLSGQLVKILHDEYIERGEYSIRWDGRDAHGNAVATGVYLYQLRVDESTSIKKMTLLR
jgi:flagellar hook assembly protein FlgD